MLKNTLLNNRYEIIDTIGIGGMAYVYKAYDTILERNVAVKILKEDFARTEDFLNKFKLEATSAASLSDENIVGIYDVGSEVIDGKDVEYIIMEMIEGKTLKSIIEDEAPLSNERIVYYARQIALALQAAHRKGVIHRDIKPANILINKNDKVKVTDFGIARVSSQETLTYTSSILGTVHYISPEQAKGMPIDDRSDLYSLGIVLYEMATGNVPFDAETPVSIAIKHLQEDPGDIKEINPDIDPNLEKIIKKLLSKDVSSRYQTATELISNLDNYKNIDINISSKPTQKIDRKGLKSNKVEYVSEPMKQNQIKEKKKNKKFLWVLLPILAGIAIYLLTMFLGNVSRKSKEDRLISVPNVYGFSESDAIATLTEANLSPEIGERVNDSKIPQGSVIKQSIEAKKKVEPNTVVKLTISLGPKLVKVPRLTGLNLDVAKQELENLGLGIKTVSKENSSKPKGTVISQDPPSYSKVEEGAKIDLVVSLGEKISKSVVPNIKGQDKAIAINTLYERDLIPGEIRLEYSNEPVDTVISQDIVEDTEVDPKTAIDFVVSKGPEPQPEPEPEPTPTPPEDDTEDNEESSKDKKYVFKITAPEGAKEFNVKIYNLKPSKKLVYEENFVTEKLDNKTAVVNVTASKDAEFEILLNDKVANVDYE